MISVGPSSSRLWWALYFPTFLKKGINMRISNSEVQVFKRCRRKWHFSYYLWLKPNFEKATGPAPIGNRIHACLNVYYESLMAGMPTDMAVDTTMAYHDNEALNVIENAGVGEDLDAYAKETDLTRIMLEGYFEWLQNEGVDEGLTVTGSETSVNLKTHIFNTEVFILAKLDIRIRRELDGAVLFMDHKTAQELSTPLKTMHLNEQFLHYDWLLRQVTGERVDGGMFNFLRKVKRTASMKSPAYGRLEVRHNDRELDAFEKRLRGEIRAILSLRQALDTGTDPLTLVYPTPTRDCCWDCPFVQICPMVDRQDGSAERVIELTMRKVDPYERYDK
jgi:hypothetical protein